MSESLPQPPDLDPASLSSSSLGRVRRGFEPVEVNQLLGRAADALRAWQERDQTLQARIDQLEADLAESHVLDEGRIASVLGEETARIISTAREAANEIRSKATDDAEQLVKEAEESSRATAEALKAEAEALRSEADTMREDAAREYSAKIEEAQTRHDTLLAEAQARHDELVSGAQARHDELLAEAQTRHDELVSGGQARHDELLAEAQARHEELTSQAERVLAERTETANAEAEQILEAARSQGRTMVGEAKAVRDRILSDLAERRRIARRQIQGAVAGRDRVIEALQAAGASTAAIVAELREADSVARDHANHVAEVLEDDTDEFLAGLDVVDPIDDFGSSDDDSGSVSPSSTVDVDEADEAPDSTDEEPDLPAAEAEEPADEPAATDFEQARDESMTDADEGDAGDEVEEGTDSGATSSVQGDATVHDLFARIRAQGIDAGGDDDDDDLDDTDEDDYDDTSGDDVGEGDDDATVIDLSTVDPGPTDELSRVAALLDTRDELLVPIERQMLRALRRLASDEQNEVLDRLRRVKRGRPEMDDVVPSAEEMLSTFSDGILADFNSSVKAGFDFWIDVGGSSDASAFVPPVDLRSRLEGMISEFISVHRAHLEKSMETAEEAGTGLDELMGAIKSVYRDWRQSSLSEMAGDLVIAGFSQGERSAAGPGVPWLWVVDNGGLPCADGEDNALAGPVMSDDAFPTGDLTPPAHSGCRCILVPADN